MGRTLRVLWMLLCPWAPDVIEDAEDLAELRRISFTLEMTRPGVEGWAQCLATEVAWHRCHLACVAECPTGPHVHLPDFPTCEARVQFVRASIAYWQAQGIDPDSLFLKDLRYRAEAWECARGAQALTGGRAQRWVNYRCLMRHTDGLGVPCLYPIEATRPLP